MVRALQLSARMRLVVILGLLVACGHPRHGIRPRSSQTPAPTTTASSVDAACATKVSYSTAWIAPANHPGHSDIADGNVTWDGTCIDDGNNSYAVLSNGWKPYLPAPRRARSRSIRRLAAVRCPLHDAIHVRQRLAASDQSPDAVRRVAGRAFWDGAAAPPAPTRTPSCRMAGSRISTARARAASRSAGPAAAGSTRIPSRRSAARIPASSVTVTATSCRARRATRASVPALRVDRPRVVEGEGAHPARGRAPGMGEVSDFWAPRNSSRR